MNPRSFRDGDALFTKGKGFIATVIRIFTLAWFKWNHVAAVVYRNGTPWVYEVTSMDSFPDGITGTPRAGVRAELLESWLSRMDDAVWHAPLVSPMTASQVRSHRMFWSEMHHNNVGYDFLGAFLSAVPGRKKPPTNATFCSAGYVGGLKAAGVLSSRVVSYEMHPHDVANLSVLQKSVRIK